MKVSWRTHYSSPSAILHNHKRYSIMNSISCNRSSLYLLGRISLIALVMFFSAKPSMASVSFRAAFADELTPLYPDSRIESVALPEPVVLDAARGTIAGVHLFFKGLRPNNKIGVRVRALDAWPSPSVEIYQLLAVPVEINSGLHSRTEKWDGEYNPYVIRRAPFGVYDVMKPVGGPVAAADSVAAFAIEMNVPVNVKPGRYGFRIVVQSGEKRLVKDFAIEVHSAVVPPIGKNTMCYTCWFSEKNMLWGTNDSLWSPAFWKILGRYAGLMAQGRQNTFRLPLNIDTARSGHPVLDTARMRQTISIFEKYGFYYVEGGPFLRADGNHLVTLDGFPVQSKRGTAEVKSILDQLGKFIEGEHLENRWFQHIQDEPGQDLDSDYIFVARLIHQRLPGVRVLEAGDNRDLVGAIDIWCPTDDQYQEHKNFYTERQRKGDECWVYTCLTPTGPWINRLMDMERLRPVYIGWGAALFGTSGFLHWGFNQYYADPFKQSVVDHPDAPHTNNQLPAGDPYIVYPGPGEPWPSVRFEAMRIGLEDRELLRQLDRKNPNLCHQIIESVFRSYDNYDRSVNVYRAAKLRLLEALSEKK